MKQELWLIAHQQCPQCSWQGKKYRQSMLPKPMNPCRPVEQSIERMMAVMEDRQCAIKDLSICPHCASKLVWEKEMQLPAQKSRCLPCFSGSLKGK